MLTTVTDSSRIQNQKHYSKIPKISWIYCVRRELRKYGNIMQPWSETTLKSEHGVGLGC